MKKIAIIATLAFAALGMVNAADALESYPGYYLKMGVPGPDANVMTLQNCLMGEGYENVGGADGYFGNLTRGQVMTYQAAMDLKIDGIVGPQTWGDLDCEVDDEMDEMDDMDEDDDMDDMSGEEASLEDFNMDSEDDAEEGQMMHVATIEFDVEDGDIMIERLDLTFNNAGVGPLADDEPWDVFETLTLMVDGDEIAEEDIDNDNDWKDDTGAITVFRVSGLDYMVDADETAEIEVYLTAQDNIDGIDDADWEIYVDTFGIRGTDGAGITQYIGDAGETVSFSVDAEGGDEDITIGSSNDDPDSALLLVDEDDDSDWHEVFVFELEADENDIDLDEIVIEVITVGGDYADLINDVMIEVDGEEFDDFDLDVTDPDAAILSFDEIDGDVTIDGDDTIDVKVMIEFKEADQDGDGIADGAYDDAGTETVQVKTVSVEGEGVDDVDDTASISGNVHTLTLTDVSIDNISWTTTSTDTTGVIDFFFTVDNSDGDEDFDVLAVEVLDDATAAFTDAADFATLSTEGRLTRVSGDSVVAIGTTGYTVANGDETKFRVRYAAAIAGAYEVTISSVAGVELDDDDQLSPTLLLE